MEKLNHDYQQKLAALDAECQKKEENLNSKTLELRWSSAEFESSEVQLDLPFIVINSDNIFLCYRLN